MFSKILQNPQPASMNFNSNGLWVADNELVAFYLQFLTGTDVFGTFKLQFSGDNVNYQDYNGGIINVMNSGKNTFEILKGSLLFFRVNWTYISGTGTLQVLATVKDYQDVNNSKRAMIVM